MRLALLGGTAIGLFATSLLWNSQQPLHLDAPPTEKEEDVVGMSILLNSLATN